MYEYVYEYGWRGRAVHAPAEIPRVEGHAMDMPIDQGLPKNALVSKTGAGLDFLDGDAGRDAG